MEIEDKVGYGFEREFNRTYFYSLSDPLTKEICYIGKTTNPQKRLKSHYRAANYYAGNIDMCNWISSLADMKLYPLMTIIEIGDWNTDSKQESKLIKKYWALGHPLLNRHRTLLQWRWAKKRKGRLNSALWYQRVKKMGVSFVWR